MLLMSIFPQKIFRISDLSQAQIQDLVRFSLDLKAHKEFVPLSKKILTYVFFEASTRTRYSFETAALRLNLPYTVFAADSTTSMTKGESVHETLNTLIAMNPDLIVVRHSGDQKLDQILQTSELAVINAGNGSDEHPTQALLDLMTVYEKFKRIEGLKVLFVGDIEHSRVARSSRDIFLRMGASVAFCAPKEYQPTTSEWKNAKPFSDLSEATRWCDVCVGLRIQKERHKTSHQLASNYEDFQLNKKNLENLSTQAVILHPGPFVPGVDLNEEIFSDPRTLIHTQVSNGVFMRMALLHSMLRA